MSPSEPPLGADVDTVLSPVALPPIELTADVTNAVVASLVVLLPLDWVVAVGLPVRAGPAKGAYPLNTLLARSPATIVPFLMSDEVTVPSVMSAETIVLLVANVPNPKVVLAAEASASSINDLPYELNVVVVAAEVELKYGSLSAAWVSAAKSSSIALEGWPPTALSAVDAVVAPVPPSEIGSAVSSAREANAVIASTTLTPSQYTTLFSPFLMVIPVPPDVITSIDWEPDVLLLTM